VFNIKSDGCYRSQLIAKELSQIEGINLNKLLSPVICYKMTYLFLAIAILEDWDIYNVNVKTAYLYSNPDKEIYIE